MQLVGRLISGLLAWKPTQKTAFLYEISYCNIPHVHVTDVGSHLEFSVFLSIIYKQSVQ